MDAESKRVFPNLMKQTKDYITIWKYEYQKKEDIRIKGIKIKQKRRKYIIYKFKIYKLNN